MLNLTPQEKTDLQNDIAEFAQNVQGLEAMSIEFLKQIAPLTGYQMPLDADTVIDDVNNLDTLTQKAEFLLDNLKKL